MKGAIYVRNTLGRRIERFTPFQPPHVKMYVCGPTPYDYTHIGHARTFVAFDGIKRYLSLRGYDVLHIQNITDIDDKIIRRSHEEGISWREVADKYTRDYLEQLEALKIKVDIHPRVTDHIREIIEFVQALIDKGYAYTAPSGSVYFDVDMYPDYGRLSGRHSREQWRQEEEVAREKKNPYDFALWKAAKPGEPSWESPWGRGRPGWHIECSVMSTRYAGGRLDIHGGAADLIFPHHENERAQSEAYLGSSPWVKYWLHTGYLTIEGEKMSKSLGNIIVLGEAIKRWGSDTLRLWLLSGHYRAQLEYNEQSLQQAGRLYERLRAIAQEVQRRLEKVEPAHYVKDSDLQALASLEEIYARWHSEMSNDFNYAGAIREVWNLTNLYYKQIQYTESGLLLGRLYRILNDMNKVYAVLDDILAPETAAREAADPYIDLLVEVRRELRKRKMYDLADAIRSRLLELGIILLDYKDRTEWRRK
ncbi:MAG: cysteine--tRNA ligase [Desulfurococcales archaeon]|nr:cysteine--tRNA ligase [Desulfurococcales archaeon]